MIHKISLEQKDATTYKLMVDDKDVSSSVNKIKFEVKPMSLPVVEISYHGLFNYRGEAKTKFIIDDNILSMASREDIEELVKKWAKLQEGAGE